MSDAELVAQDLEISYDVIEIEPIIDTILSTYPEAEGDRETVGNARARVRAVLNYLVANHESRLVLGTGNRSEAAVGYFTKYGDGAVDCHPIGNLYKGQVRQLARHVGVSRGTGREDRHRRAVGRPDRQGRAGDQLRDTRRHPRDPHRRPALRRVATARLLEVDEETVERVRGMYERSEHTSATRRPPRSPSSKFSLPISLLAPLVLQ